MLFNSIPYLFFLPIVFVAFWTLPNKIRPLLLLIVSYVFYAWYDAWYALLLLATTCFDYFCGNKIYNSKLTSLKKKWLFMSVFSNLLVLFFFKYSIFFANTGLDIVNRISDTNFTFLHNIVIPAGLSFYTFQSLSYIIDIYRRKTEPSESFAQYALFVSFFPQLVAGPIERFNDLSPQLQNETSLKSIDFIAAIRIITWGYFKKMVIADRLANFVDPVMNDVAHYSGSTLLCTGFLFAVQVYCDFSGYTDIATGSAKLLGVNLSLNWKRPLLSSSLSEFWKRNHISITTWFRDYLYLSMGGNRVSKFRWVFHIFIVFLLSALWHGANWTFVIWGLLHAVFYLFEHFYKSKFSFFFSYLGWIYLILFHSFSMLAFRALNLNDLSQIYHAIFFKFQASQLWSELNMFSHLFPILISSILIVLLFVKELQEEFHFLSFSPVVQDKIKTLFYLWIALMIFLLGNFESNEFVYFQF